MRKYIFIILFIIPVIARGQSVSNFRVDTLYLFSDSLTFDTLSIVPGSFSLYYSNGRSVPAAAYRINHVRALIIPSDSIRQRKVIAKYRCFPELFDKPYYHRVEKDYFFRKKGEVTAINEFSYDNRDLSFKKTDESIKKSGSISRGIQLGNNQNASVNSNMNLQLSGPLSDNLSIMASITDRNIPVQPDGYTQQIQDFDKIFIRIYNNHTDISFGDYELYSPRGYFMQLNKNLLGASAKTSFYIDREKQDTLITSMSTAISKGKYNKMQFNGVEGNQGPYRLTGAENESFIIVLSGSERVYVDGRLLQRGEDNDYVIDYNSGELSFTPNQPVTKDKRISIEFQYAEKNYSRFLVHSASEYRTRQASFWVNAYSEHDAKNQGLLLDLDESDKQQLSFIGDSIENAIISGIDSSGFSGDKVNYLLKDTLVNGLLYPNILYYSVDPSRALYQAVFSYVGDNRGNYILVSSSANGRQFAWVAPYNNVPQGDYEPVRLVTTPKVTQMISLGTESRLSASTFLFMELSGSNQDMNTFSTFNDSDNKGIAGKVSVRQELLPLAGRKKLSLISDYQHVQKNFNPVERYREVEFERDWNIESTLLQAEENAAGLRLVYSDIETGNAGVSGEWLNRGSSYDAFRSKLSTELNKGRYHLLLNGSLLKSDNRNANTFFTRYSGTLSRDIAKFVAGLITESEDNRWTDKLADTLLANSYYFNQVGAFFKTNDSLLNGFHLEYRNRDDFAPLSNKISLQSHAEDFSGSVFFMKNRNHTLKTNVTYRKIHYLQQAEEMNQQRDENIIGRVDHSFNAWKSFMSSATSYEAGSGLEAKKSYAYIEVNPGEGLYSWTDYNKNSVKELDEFELAVFKDQANYIRVYLPGRDYLKVYSNQFSQSIVLTPSRIIKGKQGIGKFVNRFQNRMAFRVSNKNKVKEVDKALNPFTSSIKDSNLVYKANAFRNILSFNKFNKKWGVDLYKQITENKSLLLNGFSINSQNMSGLETRIMLFSWLNYFNQAETEEKGYRSDFFVNKNYLVRHNKDENTFNIIAGTKLQMDFMYRYSDKLNRERESGREKAFIHKTGNETRIMINEYSNLSVSFHYFSIDYSYSQDTPLAYEMLEGLMPGENATWGLQYQKSFKSGLELFVNYQGRKSEKTETIHTGTLELRANF